MLDKFIFIGIGGSGGRTLRYLEADLRRRLAAYGVEGALPSAWRFLHVDVPAQPDVADAGTTDVVRYLGLTLGGERYRQMDQQVASRGDAVLRNFSAWRPDPSRMPESPEYGAGQYRVAGRVIGAAAMSRLTSELAAAVQGVRDAETQSLVEVSSAFGSNAPTAGRTWTVVVSSLGGGSGAGIYLDVCDSLRMLSGQKDARDILALLYTPDIFNDIPDAAKAGLQPNSLAAMSELVASYWNDEDPGAAEFSLITTPGVLVPQGPTRRGPSFPFLVSRTNGEIAMQTQGDVYKLVAAALGAWVTNPAIQDRLVFATKANWDLAGRALTDTSGLSSGQTQPFSSLGYASLSLGRQRFSVYSVQRLTGELAQHILFAHRHSAPSEIADEVLLNELAVGYRDVFLREAGLLEYGAANNQVLDALRGGEFRGVSENLAKDERDQLLTSVTGGLRQVVRDQVQAALSTTLQNRAPAFNDERRSDRERNARAWTVQVQKLSVDAVARSLVLNGGYGTLAILESVLRHLREELVPDLQEEARKLQQQVAARSGGTIAAAFAGAASRLSSDDSRLRQAVEGVLARWIGSAEEALSRLAAELVADYVEGFLRPLIHSLRRSIDGLGTEWHGAAGSSTPLSRWASGRVADDLLPSKFEVFLEPADEWDDLYTELLRQETGKDLGDEARRAAVAAVLEEPESWADQQDRWAPTTASLIGGEGPSRARFEVQLGLTALQGMARRWVEAPDNQIRKYASEPLSQWLAPEGKLDRSRLDAFLAGLVDVQRKSKPYVDLDDGILTSLFQWNGKDLLLRMLTPIPLGGAHPATDSIRKLLQEQFQYSETDLVGAFREDDSSPEMDILTVLAGPVSPLAVASVTRPLAAAADARDQLRSVQAARRGDASQIVDDFWLGRRARPLMQSVPLPPHLRRALIRGWYIGSALGLVDASEPRSPRVHDGSRWMVLGNLLGREPTAKGEILPAVLEGICLVLVRMPGDPSIWGPYAALAAIGYSNPDDRESPCVSRTLETWLDTGTVEGASSPLVEGGSRDERAERMVAWLTSVADQYDALADQVPAVGWRSPMPRAWEIAETVSRELRRLASSLPEQKVSQPPL